MADDNIPQIGIEQRPFLGDLIIRTGTTADAQETPQSGTPNGQSHLFAAATGSSRLHLVEDSAPVSVPEPVVQGSAPQERPRAHAARLAIDAHDHTALEDDVDWVLVDKFVKELSVDTANTRSRQDFDVATAAAGPETAYEEAAMADIVRLVQRHVDWSVINLGPDTEWSEETRNRYVQAVFDSAFRYGRFQQYLREPDVEDISIVGYDNVMVTKSNGIKEKRRPCASSDEELEHFIADLASWRGRAFSRPNGHLDLDIGGARFSATGKPITSVPNVTMRKHNHVDIDMQTLVELQTINNKMLGLLITLAQANVSALVSGWAAAGKTTFLRAWMSAIPWDEKIVTIETEHELYLGKQKHRHAQVQDFQYLPSNLSGSDMVATYSLEDAFRESLRSSAQRILFGEIRGAEGPVAIKAMQAGKGSISTIHARNADDALHRFADILMSEQGLSDDTVPLRQILRSIDIVVHLDTIPNADGTRRRIVSEIAEVIPRPNEQLPMAAQLFAWDYDREEYTMPEKPSTQLATTLRRAGLHTDFFWGDAS